METAIAFLDVNRRATLEVSWVPGHMGIEGNDRADALAKEATDLEPARETTTLAKLYQQLREEMKSKWITEWANKPMTGPYAIADRIPPSLAGPHTFRTLDRNTLGLVTQERTGYGHFGEYYITHNIQEPSECPCGAETQMHDHVLSNARYMKSTGT